MNAGAALIAAERARQIAGEGHDAAHDAAHVRDELVRAAICYSATAAGFGPLVAQMWPRGWTFNGAGGRERMLVKAGALIAAEIDRLQAARE